MSRMYYFILHLSIADLLTAFLTLIPEIVPAALFPHQALPRGPMPGKKEEDIHRSPQMLMLPAAMFYHEPYELVKQRD